MSTRIKKLFFSENNSPVDHISVENTFAHVANYDDTLYSSDAVTYDAQDAIFNVRGKITANQIRNNSDIRLKTEITNIHDSLQIVKNLKGKMYRLRATNEIHYGFIAQDVENYIPNIVGEENGYLNISYIELIPFLVESIKSLDEKIENIENNLSNLMRNFH